MIYNNNMIIDRLYVIRCYNMVYRSLSARSLRRRGLFVFQCFLLANIAHGWSHRRAHERRRGHRCFRRSLCAMIYNNAAMTANADRSVTTRRLEVPEVGIPLYARSDFNCKTKFLILIIKIIIFLCFRIL